MGRAETEVVSKLKKRLAKSIVCLCCVLVVVLLFSKWSVVIHCSALRKMACKVHWRV